MMLKKRLGILIAACCCACYLAATDPPLGSTERLLQAQGMTDIQRADSTIAVRLMYARKDNFVGRVLYTSLTRAYLHPHAAKALLKAQRALKRRRPELSLLVCDAARPMHVQKQMWDKLRHTSKRNYVSNPANGGGLHNYGLAVDITLIDQQGQEVDMGCPVDHLGTASHIDREEELVRLGRISPQALQNRRLLRKVMTEAGFKPLRTEWWHFNLCSRAHARKFYKPIP